MTPFQHLAAIGSEKEILSCMMLFADRVIPLVRIELVSDDFFRMTHRILYSCLLRMYQDQKPIELKTVVVYMQSTGDFEKLGDGALSFLTDIYHTACTAASFEYHMETVKDRARRRNAIVLMDGAIAKASDPSEELDLHAFQSELAKVSADRYVQERSMEDIMLEFLEDIGKRSNEDMNDFCVMSGLPMLDALIHGFRKQELIYLAARPSMGKSALAIQIAVNAVTKDAKSIMYVTLEMGEKQIIARAVSNMTKVNTERIMYDSKLVESGEPYDKVFAAANVLSKAKLFIKIPSVKTPQEIFNQALQIQGKHGLDMIIIDHVHLMESGASRESDNQNVNMTKISKALKGMALNLNIPVLALAQLSRSVENRNDKHPMLSDLRDSGSLEQDADKVIMLYRDSYYNPSDGDDIVEILVRKQRDGRLGAVNVKFEKKYSLMEQAEMGGNYEDRNFTPPA